MIKKKYKKTKFVWLKDSEVDGKIFQISFWKAKKQSKSNILEKFKKNLISFFSKETNFIKGPFEIQGSKIQKKIWYELKKIEYGKVKTYGQIANKYKISPRHVGKICGQNKLLLAVPCHRVIRSNGSLGGFSSIGGVRLKKKLINFEKRN